LYLGISFYEESFADNKSLMENNKITLKKVTTTQGWLTFIVSLVIYCM
jgi:hypothetical protein